ncbi:MAG: SemiSWEET transporter [Candidatus Omnitrophica bacterium]|jgi:MtN3 and saliva related transmembrane protein|nr:SemiSWEET transporter [Candidatus Omnitrophota bacterium]
MFWDIVGISAAVLTSAAFLPQIVKVVRTQSSRDLSLITLLEFMAGVFLWLLYGLHLKNAIIICANGFTLVSIFIIIALYFKYRIKQ